MYHKINIYIILTKYLHYTLTLTVYLAIETDSKNVIRARQTSIYFHNTDASQTGDIIINLCMNQYNIFN